MTKTETLLTTVVTLLSAQLTIQLAESEDEVVKAQVVEMLAWVKKTLDEIE